MSNSKKILIVEDNELNMKLFVDLLSASSYNPIACMDGLKALDFVKEHVPDLIIMDIQLPNISGLDLIKALKSNEKYLSIPIIGVTAFALSEDEERVLGSGADYYISKPINISNFIEKIKQIFDEGE